MLKRLRIFGVAAAATLFMTATASALPIVNFSTSGVWTGSGTNAITFGGGGNTATLTFTGVNTSVEAPTFISFGEVQTSVLGSGYNLGPANSGFTLNIVQTAPGAGNGSLLASVSGTVLASNQSTFRLLFSTTTVDIAGVTYTLQQPPLGYNIVPPSVNAGVTSLQGEIAGTPVPEPATMMLLGTGLLAAFRARRRQA